MRSCLPQEVRKLPDRDCPVIQSSTDHGHRTRQPMSMLIPRCSIVIDRKCVSAICALECRLTTNGCGGVRLLCVFPNPAGTTVYRSQARARCRSSRCRGIDHHHHGCIATASVLCDRWCFLPNKDRATCAVALTTPLAR